MFYRALAVLCLATLGACGGNMVDCEKGSHRSGDGCAEDRVYGQADTGDTGV
jgi:hypothetical protein